MKLHWIAALSLAALLAACNASSPTGGEAGEEGEEGEHGELPTSTKIGTQAAAAAGVRVSPAGPGEISDDHEVQGLLTPVDGAIARVMARFPGLVRALHANVGDQVRAGQPLATIESNLSLTTYTVTAPISGVVLSRDASVGTVAGEGAALYEIANLSDLWVDLHVFGRDAQRLRVGSPVIVTRMSDGVTSETQIERILPSTATASQSTVARARLRNLDGLWRPGSAVKARVIVDQARANLVVPLSALQTSNGEEVVYVQKGETYHRRPVKTGRRDADTVEILAGLKPGEQVVVQQSYLIKADMEKSTAEEE